MCASLAAVADFPAETLGFTRRECGRPAIVSAVTVFSQMGND